MPRIPFLHRAGHEPQEREAFLQRIASVQDGQLAGDLEASGSHEPVSTVAMESSSDRWAPSRRRLVARAFYRWFMRILLVVMLVVLVGLILIQWGRWTAPADSPLVNEPTSPTTAKGSQLAADPIALKWAEDAQLVSMSATWEAGQPFQDGQGDWSLQYYSPSKAATALISVDDGRAVLVGTHGVTDPIRRLQEVGWKIDSPSAIQQLRSAGGDDFLRTQPDATVSLSLDLSRDAAWSVRLIDQMSRRVFAVQVSIDSGEIIDIQQSG